MYVCTDSTTLAKIRHRLLNAGCKVVLVIVVICTACDLFAMLQTSQ